MDAKAASNWMLKKIQLDGCIYQDDVLDFLVSPKLKISFVRIVTAI